MDRRPKLKLSPHSHFSVTITATQYQKPEPSQLTNGAVTVDRNRQQPLLMVDNGNSLRLINDKFCHLYGAHKSWRCPHVFQIVHLVRLCRCIYIYYYYVVFCECGYHVFPAKIPSFDLLPTVVRAVAKQQHEGSWEGRLLFVLSWKNLYASSTELGIGRLFRTVNEQIYHFE